MREMGSVVQREGTKGVPYRKSDFTDVRECKGEKRIEKDTTG